MNVRLAEMFGYALGELVGSPYIDLVAPESSFEQHWQFDPTPLR